MSTRQEFVREGHFCEFGAILLPASACDPTHERDHSREFSLFLHMWDSPERVGEVLISVSESDHLDVSLGSDALETALSQYREQLFLQALEQVACMRDARKLEHEAAKRVQEFLKKSS